MGVEIDGISYEEVDSKDCVGCGLWSGQVGCCMPMFKNVPCQAESRKDGRSVIFVEVEV